MFASRFMLIVIAGALVCLAGCESAEDAQTGTRQHGGETVMIDFYSDDCAPCRAMHPTVDRLAESGYPVKRVNVDQHPDMEVEFGIQAIPCFVLLVDGREVERRVGRTEYELLERMFTSHNVSAQ